MNLSPATKTKLNRAKRRLVRTGRTLNYIVNPSKPKGEVYKHPGLKKRAARGVVQLGMMAAKPTYYYPAKVGIWAGKKVGGAVHKRYDAYQAQRKRRITLKANRALAARLGRVK